MSERKEAQGTLLRREDFARDPASAVKQARTVGPVTITAGGKPRMMIVIPKNVRAVPED